jgi:uncharacterized membrane protein YbhN (UPF0104 family)
MHSIGALAASTLASLGHVSLPLLVGAVAVHLGKVVVEARAWHGIVNHSHDGPSLPFRTTLGAFAGAIGANAIMPARVGEALRVGVVRRRLPRSSVATLVATIVLETALELVFAAAVVALVLLAGRSVGPVGSPTRVAIAHPWIPGIVIVSASLLVAAAIPFRARASAVGRRLARGFSVVRAPRAFGRICSWKALAWSLRIAAVFLFLLAFHLPATIWTVLAVIAAQSVAAVIPILPGSAGTQQAAFAVVLAGAASGGAVLGFGVGMQAATALADLALGAVAVACVASRDDLRAAFGTLRIRRHPQADSA